MWSCHHSPHETPEPSMTGRQVGDLNASTCMYLYKIRGRTAGKLVLLYMKNRLSIIIMKIGYVYIVYYIVWFMNYWRFVSMHLIRLLKSIWRTYTASDMILSFRFSIFFCFTDFRVGFTMVRWLFACWDLGNQLWGLRFDAVDHWFGQSWLCEQNFWYSKGRGYQVSVSKNLW